MDKASLWGQLRTSVFVVSSLMPDWFAKHSTMARIQVVFLLVVPILVRCFFEFPIAQHIPFCRSHVDRSVQYWQVAEVTKGYGQGVNKGQISNYLFRAIIPNAKLIRAALKKGENPDLLPFVGMSGQMIFALQAQYSFLASLFRAKNYWLGYLAVISTLFNISRSELRKSYSRDQTSCLDQSQAHAMGQLILRDIVTAPHISFLSRLKWLLML